MELENLHKGLSSEMREYNFDNGVNKISQCFYENDQKFRKAYLGLIQFLYQDIFKFPFYFQDTPTIRLHCPNGKNSEHYPRYHTDVGYSHPPQEINLWIPLTKPLGKQQHGFRLMGLEGTRKFLEGADYDFEKFVNSAIESKEFNNSCNEYAPQTSTKLGDCLAFDSRCLHTGEPLLEHTRVSMDIRIVHQKNMSKIPYLFQGAGKRKILFSPGSAYNKLTSDKLCLIKIF